MFKKVNKRALWPFRLTFMALFMTMKRKFNPRNSNLFHLAKYISVCFSVVLSVNAFSQAPSVIENQQLEHTPIYSHFLIGGAMKTCSSYAQANCEQGTKFSDTNKSDKTFALNEMALKRIQLFIEKYSNVHNFSNLKKLLPELANLSDSGPLTRRDLLSWLDRYRLGKEIDTLNNAEYYLFFDTLEVAQKDVKGKRIKELAKPSSSKLDAAKALNITLKQQLNARLKMANSNAATERKALMLFSTASARDIFDAVDFYQTNFEALGLSAKWWPVSPAMYQILQAAQASKHNDVCKNMDVYLAEQYMFDRARVYPDLYAQHQSFCENTEQFEQLLSQAQGVFFNGGDQSKTLAAFIQNAQTNKLLGLMNQYNREGRLLISGTSAGTAVQSGGSFHARPVPMISNGSSQNAMRRGVFAIDAPSQRCDAKTCNTAIENDDLTYRSTGGLGSFSKGVLDTHFSERDRQARLIVLSAETLSNYAFGVDETTGLLIQADEKQANFKVIGASGVFVVDNSVMQSQVIKQGQRYLSAYSGAHHYLQSGTIGQVDFVNNQWQLSVDESQQRSGLINVEAGIWREQSFNLCDRDTTEHTFILDSYEVALKKSDISQVLFNQQTTGCSLLFVEHMIKNKS